MRTIEIRMDRSFSEFDDEARARFLEGLSTVTGASLEDLQNAEFRKGCVICRVRLPVEEAMRLLERMQKNGYRAGLEFPDDAPEEVIVYAQFLADNDVVEIRDLDFDKAISTSKTREKIPCVVFVHGWSSNPADAFGTLPGELGDAAGVATHVYQYKSGAIGKFPNLLSIVHNMDNDILRATRESECLAFVGHSMGGLLLRRLIVGRQDGNLRGKDVRQLTLVASPSVGSNLATFGSITAVFTNKQLNDLSKDSRFMQDLVPRWTAWLQRHVPRETSVRAIYGDSDKVVSMTEAMAFDANPVAMLGADHSSVIKPDSDQGRRELVDTLHLFLEQSGLLVKSLA